MPCHRNSSRAHVQAAEADHRPTVTLSGVLDSTAPLEPFKSRDCMRNVTVSATLNKSIFTGCLIGSQVSQAQAEVARWDAIQAVPQAWAQRRAAQTITVSETAAARTAQATFHGMRGKYRAGRGWAAILSVVACLLCSSVASATEELPLDAQPPPLLADELWKSIVASLSSANGEVDLQRLRSTLHVEPIADDDKGEKRKVYRGVVGSDKNLGFIFLPQQKGHASDWSISFFWLDEQQDLKRFKFGNPPNDTCVHPKEIENDFITTGWMEPFGYSRFSFPINGDLPAFAIFKKKRTQMTVSVTRDGSCFYYLHASAVPLSRFDRETVK